MSTKYGRIAGLLFVSLFFALATPTLAAEPTGKSGEVTVYFGTYTWKASKGIYVARLDLASGKLSSPELAAVVESPSFLALHPTKALVYAAGEIGNFRGKKSGAVSAFSRDPKTGKLTLLNQQSSEGTGPCHLTVDRSGQYVIVVNYSSGSVASLPIEADGRLGEAVSVHQHRGSSVNKQRQEGPHAHSVNMDAANRFAFVCDLGLDQILVYRFDAASGKLTPNEPPFVRQPAGSGPRHFAFHPDGRHAYAINELKSTITAFDYDPAKGLLTSIQTVSTLPEDFQGPSTTAEVQVHPSGKFVYGSNRGHNSIAAFAVDPETGKLSLVAREPSQGKTPRNFGIDPTGQYLLAAHQDSDNVVVFRIDPKTGALKPTGNSVTVGNPVCVKMLPAGK